MSTTIAIHDLEIYAYHGVPQAEREIGHRLLIDIEFELSEKASETDAISDTVNYAAVAGLIAKVVGEESVRTLEFLCRKISKALRESYPMIQSGTISIAKPMPPMPFIAAEVRVTVQF